MLGIFVAEECADAFAHFGGGFVGEGDGKNLVRGDAALLYEIGDAVCEGFCFPGSGAGYDEDGSGGS